MSFFGHLLAGAVKGGADGFSAGLAAQDKMDMQRLVLEQRQALQDQKQQGMMDRLLQQQDFKSALADARGGSGGGKKAERDVFGDVLSYMDKGDQEGLDRYIQAVSAFNGDAGNQLRSTLRQPQPAGTSAPTDGPTEKDVLAAMGEPSASVPELPKNATRGERERLMGERALQQLAVLFRDPAKFDDYAKGERQVGLNTFGAEIAGQTMRNGGSLEDAASGFSKYSAAKDDTTKDNLAQQRIDATRERTAATDANADANRRSQELRKLQDLLAKAKSAKPNLIDPQDAENRAAIVSGLQSQIDALQGGGRSSQVPSQAPAAPFTKSALPPPRQAANRSYPPRG